MHHGTGHSRDRRATWRIWRGQMRHFEPGDLVYLRRYSEQISDWCIVSGQCYIVIEAGDTVTVMGGRSGEIIRLPAAMLAREEEMETFGLCIERE